MSYDLILDDVIHWAETYTGEPFHAMLLDPPYHLTSIVKRFGKPNAAAAKGDVYRRASAGFMGIDWDGLGEDGRGIAFKPETWYTLAQHLHPGGFIMAFAGTRGYHRMACAMEDAGLIIHPALGWVFLSGFPKATRIDTQIDKAAGHIRPDKLNGGHIGMGVAAGDGDNENELHNQIPHVIGKGNHSNGTPIDPLAQTWAGHRYGLQALKPAFEFIAIAQRPYEGRPVDCIVETGAGALWVDGGRIGTENTVRHNNAGTGNIEQWRTGKRESITGSPAGRWPANFTLTHSPDCNGTCAPDCPVRLFDEQAGVSSSGALIGQPRTENKIYNSAGSTLGTPRYWEADSGPASRIFHRSDWAYEIAEQLANADPVHYEPKASSTEREAGLDSLEVQTRHRVNSGGLENEPRFAPIQTKNHHPTVKPISLTKYLATLLLPPAAYAPRRLLVPFAGVASEIIGAILAGWDEVTGIEKTAAYLPIARARLEWWSQWPGWGQTDVDKILAAKEQSDVQLSLFA